MKKLFRLTNLVFTLIFVFTLAACSVVSSSPTAAPAISPQADTVTSIPPTITSMPEQPVEKLSPSPTLAYTQTNSPEPSAALPDDTGKITLLSHGVLPNWNYLVTFAFPEPVKDLYYLMVDTNKQYTCTTRQDFPNYLYCSGPMSRIDDFVSYQLKSVSQNGFVLEGEIYIPYEFSK